METDLFLNCHTEDSIRTRYKHLALKLHPDKNRNDPEATKKFQDMISQRDRQIKKIYAKGGFISDAELEARLYDFIQDLNNWNFGSANSMADQLVAEVLAENPNPTLGTVLKHMLKRVFQAAPNARQTNDLTNQTLPDGNKEEKTS